MCLSDLACVCYLCGFLKVFWLKYLFANCLICLGLSDYKIKLQSSPFKGAWVYFTYLFLSLTKIKIISNSVYKLYIYFMEKLQFTNEIPRKL